MEDNIINVMDDRLKEQIENEIKEMNLRKIFAHHLKKNAKYIFAKLYTDLRIDLIENS